MAKFCTGCGSSLDDTAKFCTKCGSQATGVSAPAVSAAPTTPPPTAPVSPASASAAPSAPVSVQPAPTPGAPKKSSPVLKIVLIVAGVFVLVTVAGIGSCVYGLYRVKQKAEQAFKTDGSSPSITLKTPEGDLRLGQRTRDPGEAIGGVVPYPDSVPTEAGAEFSFGAKGGISSQEYLTPDSVEKVVEFYKGKYGDQLSVIESEGHYRLALGERGGEQVTTIDVSADEETGKTKIFIAHIGKGAVQ